MTRFGKILVFVNLVLSLVFASWALAVYMLRADPTDTAAVSSAEKDKRVHVGSDKAVSSIGVVDSDVAKVEADKQDPTAVLINGLKEGKTRVNITAGGKNVGFDITVDQGAPGQLGERREEIRRLQDFNAQAEARWLAASNELKALEKQRPEDRKWYQEQLQVLERGDKPIDAVVYVKGEPQFDPQARPKMEKVAPELKPREFYVEQIKQKQDQIQEVRNSIRDKIKEQGDLTDELKRIREDLADEEAKLRSVREEREYLDPLVYNRLGESQVVVDRQRRLLARLIELYLGVALVGDTTTVAQVTPKGPAARAGMQAGDILTAVVGGKVASPRDVAKALLSHNPGDRIPVEIGRGGKTVTLDVGLGGATRVQQ
jgi:hypothetical protein